VSRHRESKSGARGKLGAIPWLALARGSMIVGRRWTALSAKERARLVELVRESRGRVGNLSVKQRLELRRLAGRLDLKGMARELLPVVRGGRRGRRRRRR
jgi:hypothetical protein